MTVNMGHTGNTCGIQDPVGVRAQCRWWCAVAIDRSQLVRHLTTCTALLTCIFLWINSNANPFQILNVCLSVPSIWNVRSRSTPIVCSTHARPQMVHMHLWISTDRHPFSPINLTTGLWSYLDMFSIWCAMFNHWPLVLFGYVQHLVCHV
jgi:hypothetical protein